MAVPCPLKRRLPTEAQRSPWDGRTPTPPYGGILVKVPVVLDGLYSRRGPWTSGPPVAGALQSASTVITVLDGRTLYRCRPGSPERLSFSGNRLVRVKRDCVIEAAARLSQSGCQAVQANSRCNAGPLPAIHLTKLGSQTAFFFVRQGGGTGIDDPLRGLSPDTVGTMARRALVLHPHLHGYAYQAPEAHCRAPGETT